MFSFFRKFLSSTNRLYRMALDSDDGAWRSWWLRSDTIPGTLRETQYSMRDLAEARPGRWQERVYMRPPHDPEDTILF